LNGALGVWLLDEPDALPINYVDGKKSTIIGVKGTQRRDNIHTPQVSGIDTQTPSPFLDISTDDYAWCIDFDYVGDVGGSNVIFGNRGGGTASPLQFMKIMQNGDIQYYNIGYPTLIAPAFVAGERYFVVLTKVGDQLTYYINGEVQDTDTVTKTMDSNPVFIGAGYPSGTSESTNISTHFAFHGRMRLDADAVRSITRNPYQLFKPIAQPIVLKDSPYQPIKEASTSLVPQAHLLPFAGKINEATSNLAAPWLVYPLGSQLPEKVLSYHIPDMKLLNPATRFSDRPPIGEMEIDPTNSLSRGLTLYALFTGGRRDEIVSGRRFTDGNTPTTLANGVELDKADYVELDDVTIGSAYSITIVDRLYSSSYGGGGFQFLFSWKNSSKLDVYIQEENFLAVLFTNFSDGHSANTHMQDDRNFLTFTVNSDLFRGYQNGAPRTVASSPTLVTPGTDILRLGARTNGQYGYNGAMELVLIHDRSLSYNEVLSLHKDPYQVLRPKKPPILKIEIIGLEVGYFVPDSRLQAPELYYPNRKPVGSVMVDPNHKGAKGLVLYLLVDSTGIQDLVSGKIYTLPTGTVSTTIDVDGIAIKSDSTSLDLDVELGEWDGAVSVVYAGKFNTSPDGILQVFNLYNTSGVEVKSIDERLVGGTETQTQIDFGDGIGSSSQLYTVSDGKWYTKALTYKSTGQTTPSYVYKEYVNGIKLGEVTQDLSGVIVTIKYDRLRLYLDRYNIRSPADSNIYMLAIYNRDLGESEAVAISANPYQILVPK